MSASSLKFIHLSDIHFHFSTSNSHYDLDRSIRHELVRDAAEMSKQQGGVDGILVSGDIAFSGQQSEYKTAHEWLKTLCLQTNCSFSNIWTVPGNHDVD